ncbi:MAG: hypothetical protein MUC69_03470 [Gemmatimonadales bacterium]|nr:hypothetical protein [Gemmatimonadales bacterium]
MRLGWLAAAALLAPPLARHDVHVSHARLVVEGATVAAQVRLFRDDLERTLRVDAAAAPARDSLLGAYLATTFVLEADGVRLHGRVEGSGIERDRDQQDVVWVLLDFPAQAPVRRVRLRNVIFMETWPDQQNIVQVLLLPAEERRTLYFAPGDARAQEVRAGP